MCRAHGPEFRRCPGQAAAKRAARAARTDSQREDDNARRRAQRDLAAQAHLDAALWSTIAAEQSSADDVERFLASLPSDLHRQLALVGGSFERLDSRWGLQHHPEMLITEDGLGSLWRRPPAAAGEVDSVTVTGPPGTEGWLSVRWRGVGDEASRSRWVAGLTSFFTSLFESWTTALRG